MTNDQNRGAALIPALVTLLVVTLIAGTTIRSLVAAHRQLRRDSDALQAQWLAESAVARAVEQLARQTGYTGEIWQPKIEPSGGPPESGTAEIRIQRVDSEPHRVKILIEAHYPNHDWRRVTVSREHSLSLAPPSAP